MGFIGTHWVKRLIKEGHQVYGLDIKPIRNEFKNLKNFKYIKKSVFDYELIEKLIKKNDIICHFVLWLNPWSI